MVLPSAAGARFRQRKISVKQTLQVFKQSDIADLETEDQQRELQKIETGVEKGEEEEEHLQRVINAAQAAVISGGKVEKAYIPTPDASQVWKDYDKYYRDKFQPPGTYIRFSATVEETSGCIYNLDEEDESFLKEVLNKNLANGIKPCTETELEIVLQRFEVVIDKKQPFLAMDPSQILTFEELHSAALVVDPNSIEEIELSLEKQLGLHPFRTLLDGQRSQLSHRKLAELLRIFGQKIYDHWKQRRIVRHGRPITAQLRFEDSSEKDDSDPYVCFRRREFRQARKTRRTDTQGSERLRKLHRELKQTRDLLLAVAQREVKRKEAIEVGHEVFQLRCSVKTLKRDLGVKGEEEDLVAHKRKKVVPTTDEDRKYRKGYNSGNYPNRNQAQAQQQQQQLQQQQISKSGLNPVSIQPYVKLPMSRIPDMDLVTVSTVLNEKDEAINRAVAEKLRQRKESDRGWVNLTDDPFNPFLQFTNPDNILEKGHFPYSSIAAALFEVDQSNYFDPEITQLIKDKKPLPRTLCFKDNALTTPLPPSIYEVASNNKLDVTAPICKVRKRMGRRGLWIDRKMTVDEPLDEFLDFSTFKKSLDADITDRNSAKSQPGMNVYDSVDDANSRLRSRFSFDRDVPLFNPVDPSELNQISSQTQSIRFGCMLLTKAYEQVHQAKQKLFLEQQQHQQKQQQKLLQQRQKVQQKLQQQQQQQAQQQTPKSNTNKVVNQINNTKSPVKQSKIPSKVSKNISGVTTSAGKGA
ncbi:hypothetical protein LJB42_000825 [Komagataella kurtzmanii]|nr:hypothetical protein LJB42_000825 [Komagataella kurtzmanii]